MVVVVLSSCPEGLRGHLTRWLLEVSPGVFVGHLTTRIRDHLWLRVLEMCKDGRAIMIFGTNGEQRLGFKVHNHSWEVVDVDGVSLMRRQEGGMKNPMRRGWSAASRVRRSRR